MNGVNKLENKMNFYFKDINKEINIREKDEKDYRNDNICRFFEKKIESDKVRDHCHSTVRYRVPAHSICNNNVTQDQSNFLPLIFHIFSNYDCHILFKKLVDKKNDKVNFDILPKINEEYVSATYGCFRFIDSYQFLSSSLDSIVKTLVDNSYETLKYLKNEIVDNDEKLIIIDKIEEDRTIEDLKKECPNEIEKLEEALLNYMGENDLKILKTHFPDKWKYLTKKIAYSYEYFNSIDAYQKPVNNLKKEEFFNKSKNDYLSDKEIERTKEIIKRFNFKNGEELTRIFLKRDVLLLTCVF